MAKGYFAKPGKLEFMYSHHGIQKIYHIQPQFFDVSFLDIGISKESLDALDLEINGKPQKMALVTGNVISRNYLSEARLHLGVRFVNMCMEISN